MTPANVNRTTTGSNAMADVIVALLSDRGFEAERLEAAGHLSVRLEDGSFASVQCQFYVPLTPTAVPTPGLATVATSPTITPAGLT